MSRPLRHAPPVANRQMIPRSRLLARVQSRFERPLTAVVAAAGFGKTTLLTQAVAENALSPVGTDHWLTCQREDSELSFLGAGVFAALGLQQPVPDDPREAAVAVAEGMWGAAPGHVALVLDDVHLVGTESAGCRFLRHLVEELPRNGHLVIAARPPLPLFTQRLVASGDAEVVDDVDLQFQAEELRSFAESRGVSVALLEEVGGWPALAELTATAGSHAVTGFVWEEMLSQLSPERRHALALLVAVGGADQEIADALLGTGTSLEALLEGLPLIVRGPTGWWSLHGLWAAALQHHLDAGQVADAKRAAGRVLWQRCQYHEAMDLLIESEAWDDARALIVDVCEVFTALVPPDVLRAWLRRLPAAVRESPEGLLLAAMAIEPTSPSSAERLLEQALSDAGGEPPVVYACLNALVLLAFWRADRERMQALADRLEGLARAGHGQAPALVALVRASLARDADDVRAELAVPQLAIGGSLSPVQDWLHAHIVLTKLGDPAGAEPVARVALGRGAPTMQAVTRCVLVDAARLRGRLDEAEALLPQLLADVTPGRVLCSPEVVTCAAVLLSLLGRHEEAVELGRAMEPTLLSSPVAWAPTARALAEAFHAVSLQREESAAAALRSVLPTGVARSRAVVQVSPAALPLLYVLVPEVRRRWDSSPAPGCFAEVLEVVHALVAVRERGSLGEVRRLPRTAPAVARAQLPVPWATELALAMVTAGRPEGRTLLADLGSAARPTMKAHSATPLLAAAARALLRETPAVPSYRLQIRVLGPLELLRDGVPVVTPELRRERVRQLLAHLLLQGRTTRSAVMAELWPDLDEAAASRNLRVTLTYLQNVLEPERSELDPPYFLRCAGPVLQLVGEEALEVDAVQFERRVDEALALERQGALSAALDAYLQATELWGGDYLADVPGDDVLQRERDRLRTRFVASAVRAGHLLVVRGDVAEAHRLADRALRADPWSESAYQLLIAVHLATDDMGGAHRTLRRCRQMLRELGVPPNRQTVTLARQLQPVR